MMKMNSMKKMLSLILSIVLIAAMALTLTGCGGGETETTPPTTQAPVSDVTVMGEGETVFTFTVVDLEGTETKFEIHTNETTVGAALLALGIIEGHDSEYGLYVDAVNGIALDWDKDGKYWAFYVDGEYAITGVDSTDIVAGSTYTFKAE